MTTYCRHHCPSCEAAGRPSCFTSLKAFDAHIDAWQDDRHNRCVAHRSAANVKALAELEGICRLGADSLPRPAGVYEHRASAAHIRAYRRDASA